MDPDIAAKIERLEDLADEFRSEDRFRRLTAYVIVKVLTDELYQLAQEGSYPYGNINTILVSAKGNAAALAKATSDTRSEDDLVSFYYQDISKLRIPTCFRKG